MSQQLGMNLLFYSRNPQDKVSGSILEALQKNPGLDKQFFKICVETAKRIPQLVIRENVVPVVVASGFNKLIKGYDALTWIQNSSAGVGDNGPSGFSKCDQIHSAISMDDRDSLRQYQEDQYNVGFDKGVGGEWMTKTNDQQRITTYTEDSIPKGAIQGNLKYNDHVQRPQMHYQPLNDMTGGNGRSEKAELMNQRLKMLEAQRNSEFSAPVMRVGGLPSVNTRPDQSPQAPLQFPGNTPMRPSTNGPMRPAMNGPMRPSGNPNGPVRPMMHKTL